LPLTFLEASVPYFSLYFNNKIGDHMLYGKESTRVDKSYDPFYETIYYAKNCCVCGDAFMSSRPKGKYCSQRCSNDAYIVKRRKRAARKRAKVKTCIICATPIEQGTGKIKKYCSNACKQKAHRARKSGFDDSVKT